MVNLKIPAADHDWPFIQPIKHEADQLQINIQIPGTLRWFDGHFPDQPVLPGVAQVFWADYLAKQLLPDLHSGCHLKSVKFNRIILPDTQVQLNLQVKKGKQQVNFIYQHKDEICSSGSFRGQST